MVKQRSVTTCFKILSRRKMDKDIQPPEKLHGFQIQFISFSPIYRLFFLACSIVALFTSGYWYCFCLLYIFLGTDVMSVVLSAVRHSGKWNHSWLYLTGSIDLNLIHLTLQPNSWFPCSCWCSSSSSCTPLYLSYSSMISLMLAEGSSAVHLGSVWWPFSGQDCWTHLELWEIMTCELSGCAHKSFSYYHSVLNSYTYYSGFYQSKGSHLSKESSSRLKGNYITIAMLFHQSFFVDEPVEPHHCTGFIWNNAISYHNPFDGNVVRYR